MEVSKQDLARAQHRALGGLGFLDLDDHIGRGKDARRVGSDRRPGRDIIVVGKIDAATGLGFDRYRMAGNRQLGNRWRRQTDPIFVDLDLLGYTDMHRGSFVSDGAAL